MARFVIPLLGWTWGSCKKCERLRKDLRQQQNRNLQVAEQLALTLVRNSELHTELKLYKQYPKPTKEIFRNTNRFIPNSFLEKYTINSVSD